MRSSNKRSRSKNNRNRPSGGNIINRVFDSSGPEGKVRGTPQQIIDKYNQLTRDAQLSGDRVAAENFAQHAEHYTRMLAEAQREIDARQDQHNNNQNRQQNDGGQNSGQDNRSDNRGNDNRQNDNRQSDNRGNDTRGNDDRQGDNRGDNRQNDNRQNDNRQNDNRGDDRQSDNRQTDNRQDRAAEQPSQMAADANADGSTAERGEASHAYVAPTTPVEQPERKPRNRRKPVIKDETPTEGESGLVETPEDAPKPKPKRTYKRKTAAEKAAAQDGAPRNSSDDQPAE